MTSMNLIMVALIVLSSIIRKHVTENITEGVATRNDLFTLHSSDPVGKGAEGRL